MCCKNQKLTVGQQAPDFTAKDDQGTERSLHEFRGHKVVLYFYPKDDTPGCTKEACSFRNDYDSFNKSSIIVLGVSYDSVESHQKFKAKYNLPFILLSDESKKIAQLYGASSKWLWIFNAPIPSRITFLIDENGIIKNSIKNVSVTNHAEEVLKLFGA